jgi:hypothetical protein
MKATARMMGMIISSGSLFVSLCNDLVQVSLIFARDYVVTRMVLVRTE